MLRNRFLVAIAAIATALVLVSADANARAGGGFSGGSRGMRTFTPPPATSTAPKSAAPMQRTLTQPGTAGTVGQGATRGLFGGGLFGGLAAGFLGAGLFGMLFGHGFFGGMGGFASLLGLMLQLVLLVIVARLLFAWWQRRSEPAFAAAHPATGHNFSGLGGMFGGVSGGSAPAGQPLAIDKSDYDAFERLLGKVQAAYSAEDLGALRNIVTPEMLSYFSEQLSENASRGVINKISDVKLEQGDLAEAWREDGVEYATVAMRFSLVDQMVDRASGRVVGDGGPGEATELWTFMRSPSGAWLLSAIQQT